MASITLDTTLAELCQEHGIHDRFIAFLHDVYARIDLDPYWPKESVYVKDEEPAPLGSSYSEISEFKRTALGSTSIRRAWIIGEMELICLRPYVKQEDIQQILQQLPHHQRFIPKFVDLRKGSVASQLKSVSRNRTLMYCYPQGWMQQHEVIIDPDESFRINSKEFLVTSGIKTPPSVIIKLESLDSVATRKLPFVVKLCLSEGGDGTFLITSESRRQQMFQRMIKYRERRVQNVLVSDYVPSVQEFSIHFFIGAPGDINDRSNPMILGVATQSLEDDVSWIGCQVDYAAQTMLASYTFDIVRDTAMKLPASYVGLCGIDLLIDESGKQWVVDLNARLTGSLPICLMSTHFWKERGLSIAELLPIKYNGDIDDIHDRLDAMIHTGQVIIMATTTIRTGVHKAHLAVGAKDSTDLSVVRKSIGHRLKNSS